MPIPPEVSSFPPANVPGQPIQGRLPFPNQPQAGFQPGVPQPGVQQPGFQQPGQPVFPQPGQPGFQQPGQPGFQQPGSQQLGGNQSSVGASTYVGGNQPYVGGSQPYVGGGASIGSQLSGPGTPGLIQGNPNPYPQPVQNFGQQGIPGGFPQPGLPQQNFPQQNFPQPQVNQGQFNQPVPNAGFPPQGGGGAPNAATQLIQNILTTPRQGGLPGAQPAGQQVGGGLAGVASTSENPSIMVYNDRTSYNEWEFIFDFAKQRGVVNPNAAGVIGTPASQIGTVAGPNPQPPILVGSGLGSLGQTGQQPIGAQPGATPFGGANQPANPAAGQTPGGPSQGQPPPNIRMGRP
jgi:hypothetical protein